MKNDYDFITSKQKKIIIISAVVVVLLAIVSFILIHYRVTNVDVVGNTHYTADEIKAMVLNGNVTDNSLLLKLKYKNKSIEDVPFVETMDVEVLAANEIRITVYEKSLAGCVSYLGNYMYFDREGIIVESANVTTVGVPEITGLHFSSMQLYEQLPVDNPEVFQMILELTQLLDKYEIVADKIYFDSNLEITLYFDEARAIIGSTTNIDEKIMQLPNIVPVIRGKKGVIDMSNYDSTVTSLTFEPED